MPRKRARGSNIAKQYIAITNSNTNYIKIPKSEHTFKVLIAFLLQEVDKDLKYILISSWKKEKFGVNFITLHLWIKYFASKIIKLQRKLIFPYCFSEVKIPNKTSLKKSSKSLCMNFTMNWQMSCQSFLVWTQCQKRCRTVSGCMSQKVKFTSMLKLNFETIKVLTG